MLDAGFGVRRSVITPTVEKESIEERRVHCKTPFPRFSAVGVFRIVTAIIEFPFFIVNSPPSE